MTRPDYKQIALLLTDPNEISNRKLAQWLNVSEAQIRKAKKCAVDCNKSDKKEDDRLDEVRSILAESLNLKANAGGAIKAEIRRALELINYKDKLI